MGAYQLISVGIKNYISNIIAKIVLAFANQILIECEKTIYFCVK